MTRFITMTSSSIVSSGSAREPTRLFAYKFFIKFSLRHKQAQYAGRASLLLNTLLYFKDRVENHEAFVMGIRKNGIQVFLYLRYTAIITIFSKRWKSTYLL